MDTNYTTRSQEAISAAMQAAAAAGNPQVDTLHLLAELLGRRTASPSACSPPSIPTPALSRPSAPQRAAP